MIRNPFYTDGHLVHFSDYMGPFDLHVLHEYCSANGFHHQVLELLRPNSMGIFLEVMLNQYSVDADTGIFWVITPDFTQQYHAEIAIGRTLE